MQQIVCPYPGLRPFNEEESIFFKGREQQVERIVKRLGEKKFLMLNGASGDGKSSLMFAGVIPYAKAGFFKTQFDNWLIVNFRPERKPLSNFTNAFCQTLKISDVSKTEKEFGYGFSALIDIYKSSNFYFDDSAPTESRNRRKAANLLILVDQFEEFFTNAENYSNGMASIESQKTVNLILETYRIAEAQNLPVYVVCTMRSDYMGQCAVFRGLPEAIGYSQFFVPRLKRSELQEVIEGPAVLCGGGVGKGLTQYLLNQSSEGLDQLPILQHALNSMWKVANDGTEVLEKIHLAKVGGISPDALLEKERLSFQNWFDNQATYKKELFAQPSLNNVLQAHANELVEFLPDYYQANSGKALDKELILRILKVSFQCLTSVDNGRAVRRRTTLKEITSILNDEAIAEKDVDLVLRIFREQGNTFLQPFIDEGSSQSERLKPETVLDITHESLIRNWSLLSDWANEEFENYGIWQDGEKQLNRWLTNKESNFFLLSQGTLAYFGEWQLRFKPNHRWLLKYDEVRTSSLINEIPSEQKIIAFD